MGLRQPSLYRYFSSRTAVYDALFERGMRAHHDAVATAIGGAPAGWAAVRAAMTATLDMYAAYFRPDRPGDWAPWPTSAG